MEKLKEMVMKMAIAEKKQPLTSSQIALIHQRLHQAFPLGIRTPNHPTYASMIYKAIADLNEEGGSSETSISEYMRANFEDLPWAHNSYLNHHLNKLCDEGFLVFSAADRCYSLFTEFNSVNQTATRHRSSFSKQNESTEIEVYGIGDEHSTILCEIQVLRENPGQEQQEHSNAVITLNLCKPKPPKLTDLTIDKALLDESRDDTGTNVLFLEHHCHDAELMIVPKRSGLSGIKRNKKQVIKWTEKVAVCGLPAKLEHRCHDGELILIPKRSGLSGIKRKKKEAIKWTEKKVVVFGLPAKLPDPRRSTARKKRKLKGKSTDLREHEIQQGPLSCTPQEIKIIQCKESKWTSLVQSLLQTRFFGECEVHANTIKKRLCNFYCLDCTSGALCASCLTDSHEDHSFIKIRRTSYEDAVNVATIQMYMDISGIHTHKVNTSSSTFVSLKRAVPSKRRGTIHRPCVCCNRHVPDPFCCCSLSCKYKHQVGVGAPSMVD